MAQWTKRSAFTEQQWAAMSRVVADWSGRGLDPDKDLAEAREGYPDLTLVPNGDWEADYWGLAMEQARDMYPYRFCLQVTCPLEGRLWDENGNPVDAFPMGSVRLRLHVFIEDEYVMAYPGAYDPSTGEAMRCNHHLAGTGYCLGEGEEEFDQAMRENRWGDALDILASVATTFRYRDEFDVFKQMHAERLKCQAAVADQGTGGE